MGSRHIERVKKEDVTSFVIAPVFACVVKTKIGKG